MSLPIEDYALIGDCRTAALVAKNGSIDWLCMPRFDSGACFAALLGDQENGRWIVAPDRDDDVRVARSYRDHTLILETEFTTPDGTVAVIDFMPPRDDHPMHVVRIVEGRAGRVAMRSAITLRFNYGSRMPWVTQIEGETCAVRGIAGPDMVTLRAPVPITGEGMQTVARFDVEAGQRLGFVLSYCASHMPVPEPNDPEQALADTVDYWERWGARELDAGPYTDIVKRSLMVLKALTYEPTGGIVAAPTTSVPEMIGSVRNWDYRYCWLRDATLTLFALMNAGHFDEAKAWRQWLERTIAGDASQLQIMYGLAGETRLEEWEVETLAGYEGSKPVRIGNAASGQLQLDVYGQVLAVLHYARVGGLDDDNAIWPFQLKLLEYLERIWREPDHSIWEIRGEPQHFTFSKLMVWTAFDRAIDSATQFGLDGPVDRWRDLRDEVAAEICERAWDEKRGAFVQAYGSPALDASILLMPIVKFLPADDPRMLATVAAIERELVVDGFVLRYSTDTDVDGLPPGEGVFLACSFWLVEVLRLQGRVDDATRLFERLCKLANDVGLLAEEYDPEAKRMLGNFPQAFSHVALINAALGLTRAGERVTDDVDRQSGGEKGESADKEANTATA